MYTSNLPSRIDQSVVLRDIYFYGLDRKEFGFVLTPTPTCDFAQDKAELIHLCAMFTAASVIEQLRKTTWEKLAPKELKNQIKQFITQRLPRYHFFAPLPGMVVPLLADFQVITSLPLRELESLEIVAELESPFREQVPARYAAYMGRVGTPDFLAEDAAKWLNFIFDDLKLS